MKRYRVDFSYGRYFFAPADDGDWVHFEDIEQLQRDYEATRALNVRLQGEVDSLRAAVPDGYAMPAEAAGGKTP